MRLRNIRGQVISGLRLIHKVIPILGTSKTTLIFINTRGMSETWYQSLLTVAPDLAGAIALASRFDRYGASQLGGGGTA